MLEILLAWVLRERAWTPKQSDLHDVAEDFEYGLVAHESHLRRASLVKTFEAQVESGLKLNKHEYEAPINANKNYFLNEDEHHKLGHGPVMACSRHPTYQAAVDTGIECIR